MRCSQWFVTALSLFQLAAAVDQKKSAIIWFDDASTPDEIVNQVKDGIVKAGGKVTHYYTIIRYIPSSKNANQSFINSPWQRFRCNRAGKGTRLCAGVGC